ncbi:UDP-glycosyltransferase 73B5-like [Elaeis guineensis]|uniref:UDP-glycosyltransferase 73B5-like n=1 Tax=Elaeis guineensis var. tenera TaxID=51953 RepID=A0A6I9R422_ELAGV|nr:UDP-glycosyltransferase 73B5-like [Elaeis guineensis]
MLPSSSPPLTAPPLSAYPSTPSSTLPSIAFDLPPGIENISALSPPNATNDATSFFTRPEYDRLLHLHYLNAIVVDTHFSWTTAIAHHLGIHRLSFHAISLFSIYIMGALLRHLPHLSVSSDNNPFVARTSSTPSILSDVSSMVSFTVTAPSLLPWTTREIESSSLGIVIDSFIEIESAYTDHYLKIDHKQSWFVGLVALASANVSDLATRGGDDLSAAANYDRYLF